MSAEGFQIGDRDVQPAISVRAIVPPEGISEFIGTNLPTLFAYAGQQGALGDMSLPFARYFAMDDASWDVEVGITLARSIPGDGAAIGATTLPGGRVASLIHAGPYDAIGTSYEALMAWVAKHRERPSGPMWESYLTDPGENPDPATWRTEVCVPLG